jgi:hypothetical protein
MRYSFDEFRRIFVEENTFIDNNDPIIPKGKLIKNKITPLIFSYQQLQG